jgi:3',5'-cyclic-AMP phosphodiesterase
VLAQRYVESIDCGSKIIIPGNHDSRNVGYVHFEELFGDRNSVLRVGDVTIVAVDSTEPDLDNGQIGRGRYGWIEEQFSAPADLRVFVVHHHLLPVPGTGRERNIVNDAGDALECLQRAGVDLVLSGHKHVPYAWRLEDLFIVNAGTVSSSRLRGNGRPCYNIVEVSGTHVDVWRKYPFHSQERIIQFSTETKTYEKYTARIEGEVTSNR